MDWRAQSAQAKSNPQEEEEEKDELDSSEDESDSAPKEVCSFSFFKNVKPLLNLTYGLYSSLKMLEI